MMKIHKSNSIADPNGNSGSSTSETAVTVTSLWKLALHEITLGGAVVRAKIYHLYLLHSHARNSLINQVT